MNSDGAPSESTESGVARTGRGRRSDAAGADGPAAAADADANPDDDDGYVHRPDAAGSPGEAGDAADAGDVAATTAGVRGWALVGVVVTCFLVIPGIIYLRPAAPGQLGVSFFVAMLVLPMLPAVLLGLTAVWSMRGPREGRDER